MLVERGVVKVGIEIEIPTWKNGRNYTAVVRDLLNAGYMMGGEQNWREIHTYRCRCEYGCGLVRSGDVFVPPLVSATYDASLPREGGEFVVSPIVLLDGGLAPIREIWDIVTRDAVWTDQLPDRRGDRMCSPSIHLHCSVTLPNVRWEERREEPRRRPITGDPLANDVLHALFLFGPELLLLADTAGVRRGLRFRQLLRAADQGGHHGFVDIRAAREGYLHVEWRLFEAAYENFEYVEAAAYLSGVLTRALVERANLNRLMAAGLLNSFDENELTIAVFDENMDAVLGMVSSERFRTLRDMVLTFIDDDRRGYEILSRLFERAERRLP